MKLLDLFFWLPLLHLPQFQVQALSIARNHIQQLSTIENLQFSQRPETLERASIFEVEFTLSNERPKLRLSLHPTRNIISHQTDVQHVGPDGSSTRLASRDSPLIYKGDASISGGPSKTWREAGWARVMVRTRQGVHLIEGAFSIDGVHYHIAVNSNFRTSQLSHDAVLPKIDSPHMLVWKESDAIDGSNISRRSTANDSVCLTENSLHHQRSFTLDSEYEVAGTPGQDRHNPLRRQNSAFNPVDVIGSTSGCPSERLVAMIGIATDCTYTAEFDSVDDARNNIISQINIASQAYEDAFNIALAIRNLSISDASCPSSPSSNRWNVPCSANIDLSGRLGLFSEWRTQYRDDNAAWTLLSTCGSGSTVGIARVGTICSSRSRSPQAGSASANVVVRTNAEWQVIAHELGHNFGAQHDCTSSTCSGNSASDDCCPLSASTCDAGEQYLMNPRSGRSLENFSPCTIGSICTTIGRDLINTSCLVNEDDAADINDSQCGNGIVEPGEACDCGGEEGCDESSCCNPSTCQLRSGAVCDPDSDGCCTDQCQVAERGQVCRASVGFGDAEEACDGSSSQCPEDDQDDDGDDGGGRGGRGSGNRDSGGTWLDQNRTLVIALSASIGGLFVALITICIIRSCVRKRRNARTLLQRNRGLVSGPDIVASGQAPMPLRIPRPPQMVHRYA